MNVSPLPLVGAVPEAVVAFVVGLPSRTITRRFAGIVALLSVKLGVAVPDALVDLAAPLLSS